MEPFFKVSNEKDKAHLVLVHHDLPEGYEDKIPRFHKHARILIAALSDPKWGFKQRQISVELNWDGSGDIWVGLPTDEPSMLQHIKVDAQPQ